MNIANASPGTSNRLCPEDGFLILRLQRQFSFAAVSGPTEISVYQYSDFGRAMAQSHHEYAKACFLCVKRQVLPEQKRANDPGLIDREKHDQHNRKAAYHCGPIENFLRWMAR